MNQQHMNQPPEIITSKDLSYIKDALSWELTAMKKCNFYSQQTNSIKVKEALDQAGQMHKQHYETLLQHLDENKAIN